jgi:hypothetical protein
MPRIRRLRLITTAILLFVTLVIPRGSVAQVPTDFPLGWYDGMSNIGNLSEIKKDGMTSAVAYFGSGSRPALYLDAARSAGLKVFLEIPRSLVKNVDVEGVKSYVSSYKAHSALYGWYLADEPSLTQSLGPLSGENARHLYQAVKAVDPNHPVSIAFSSREDPTPYLGAMDILMHDDYPFYAPAEEFKNLGKWSYMTSRMGATAKRNNLGFFPVLQAFGGTNEQPVIGYRAPTAKEQRYMVYTALQTGGNGLYFWVYYRSNPQWVDEVLMPLVNEVTTMKPALAAGERPGLASSSRTDVGAVVFRDPTSGSYYLISIHHGAGTVDGTLTLSGELSGRTSATQIGGTNAVVPIVGDKLVQTLGSYEVKLYRID